MKIKSGFVTIVGKPNVGKSTLTNKLLGEELSIINSKPQTTRKRVLGILSEEEYQIIFLDTPGILDPKYLMQKKLAEYIETSVKDADILVFMITIKNLDKEVEIFEDEKMANIVSARNRKKILIINKIDLSNEETVRKALKVFGEMEIFDNIIKI